MPEDLAPERELDPRTAPVPLPDPETLARAGGSTAGGTIGANPDQETRAKHLSAGATVAVPGYEILGELGRGGMGVVYKARQVKLNRTVALKMVLGDGRAGTEAMARFLAEAEAAAAVRHPNVVAVYEFGECDCHPFLVLEYLPGGTLSTKLKAGRLAPRVAGELVRKLASGVGAAHSAGIVHRDLKPGNVLFDEHGEPKIADFGLAKRSTGSDLTMTGAVMGTPSYMAPEQARGDTRTARPAADVYALGVILYECLTGSVPFTGESPLSVLRQVADEPAPPPRKLVPGVPADLEAVCLKCLEKDPADRYHTAAELADDLGRYLAGETVRGPRSGLWYRARKVAVRRWRGAAVVFVICGLVVAAWMMPSPLDRQPPAGEHPPAAPSETVSLRVRVKPEGEERFVDDPAGRPVGMVGVWFDAAPGEPPLRDVEFTLSYFSADGESRDVRRSEAEWAAGETELRRVGVFPQPYRKVEIRGTATRDGRKVALTGSWAAR